MGGVCCLYPPARQGAAAPWPATDRSFQRAGAAQRVVVRGITIAGQAVFATRSIPGAGQPARQLENHRSEEHTSELQSLMRISYAVFCLKKKKEDTLEIKPYTVIIEHERQ